MRVRLSDIRDRMPINCRCVDGRVMRHDPQHDDPDLETDIGECPFCKGKGCDAERKIITRNTCPPIPIRSMDWCAYYDGDEPNDEGQMMMGYGATEQEAIDDLNSQAEALS